MPLSIKEPYTSGTQRHVEELRELLQTEFPELVGRPVFVVNNIEGERMTPYRVGIVGLELDHHRSGWAWNAPGARRRHARHAL